MILFILSTLATSAVFAAAVYSTRQFEIARLEVRL
jgi:hypothetical protein